MAMQPAIIHFTEDAQEELAVLTQEMRLGKLLKYITPQSSLPQEVKDDLQQLAFLLADLFGEGAPGIEEDPMEALRTASRDINLARVLKERGLFRLYRILNATVSVVDHATGEIIDTPAYSLHSNPDTGEPFRRREDFISWFCREAHVARSLVFQRMATIDRLLDLGIPLEETYQIILAKPYAVREALKTVGIWDHGQLIDVSPLIATRVTERMLPEKLEEVQALAEATYVESPDVEERTAARIKLANAVRPAIAELVREVAVHPSTRDAMDFVRHDVACKPEIKYRWNYDKDYLEVEYIRKSLDPAGTEYISDIVVIPMIPDIAVVPDEVRQDLITRLPVKNRDIKSS